MLEQIPEVTSPVLECFVTAASCIKSKGRMVMAYSCDILDIQ